MAPKKKFLDSDSKTPLIGEGEPVVQPADGFFNQLPPSCSGTSSSASGAQHNFLSLDDDALNNQPEESTKTTADHAAKNTQQTPPQEKSSKSSKKIVYPSGPTVVQGTVVQGMDSDEETDLHNNTHDSSPPQPFGKNNTQRATTHDGTNTTTRGAAAPLRDAFPSASGKMKNMVSAENPSAGTPAGVPGDHHASRKRKMSPSTKAHLARLINAAVNRTSIAGEDVGQWKTNDWEDVWYDARGQFGVDPHAHGSFGAGTFQKVFGGGSKRAGGQVNSQTRKEDHHSPRDVVDDESSFVDVEEQGGVSDKTTAPLVDVPLEEVPHEDCIDEKIPMSVYIGDDDDPALGKDAENALRTKIMTDVDEDSATDLDEGVNPERGGSLSGGLLPGLCLEWRGLNFTAQPNNKAHKKQILTDCYGTLYPGEVCALIGPSGAGKSTLMNLLAGRQSWGDDYYRDPNSGKVKRKKKTSADVRMTGSITYGGVGCTFDDLKNSIGYVMQEDAFLATQTVEEVGKRFPLSCRRWKK